MHLEPSQLDLLFDICLFLVWLVQPECLMSNLKHAHMIHVTATAAYILRHLIVIVVLMLLTFKVPKAYRCFRLGNMEQSLNQPSIGSWSNKLE